jgi:CobQ-like glutamine amidotransferase family enzyme
VKIAVVFPELLGTYGDGGNALSLAWRGRARGIDVSVEEVALDAPLPDADLYLLGGGEDGPQRLATERLREVGFVDRIAAGAHVFAVCAGLQILGSHFAVEGDDLFPGLGLVPAVTVRGTPRAVGDLAVRVGSRTLVGFENHGGRTSLGEGLGALGEVVRGVGNDGHVDGFSAPRLWATYAHGPVLAQNPWFCDQILETISGKDLTPLVSVADRLYETRVSQIAG